MSTADVPYREKSVERKLDDNRYFEETEGARLCIGFSWSLGQFLWGIFLLSVAFVKIFENSFIDYIKHFTNVSWSWQAFFFLATSPGPVLIALRMRRPLRFVVLVIAIVLMPLFGIVVGVAIIIFILIGSDAKAITDAFLQYPPEKVMIANDIFHVVPVISLLFYIALTWLLAFYALNLGLQAVHYAYHDRRIELPDGRTVIIVKRFVVERHLSIPFFIYQAYAGSFIPVLFYIAVFDPREVYGTDMSYPVGFALFFLSLTFSNAIPLTIAICAYGLGSRNMTVDDVIEKRKIFVD